MNDLFRRPPAFIGVVHLAPLPGAPRFAGSLEEVLERAESDARSLLEGGCDALVIENFGDAPFFRERVPPETVAAMALAIARVRRAASDAPVGVNVLRNDGRAALGLAAATGARFVRVNVLVGAMATDQGIIEGRAAELLRERERLAPGVGIFADVLVKHASPLGSPSLAEAAADTARRGLADALILTGTATGRPPTREALAHVRRHVPRIPLLVGSGVTDGNARRLLEGVDGAIVGTWLKEDGEVDRPVDPERVRALARVLEELREERGAL